MTRGFKFRRALRRRTSTFTRTPGKGGAGGAAGLGVPRTVVETQLAGFGAQFAPGPDRNGQPTVVGQMQGTQIQLIGPPEALMGVSVKGTAPEAQAMASAEQMQIFASQIAPDIAPELRTMLQEAQQTGESKRNLGGVSATISMKPAGEEIAFEITFLAAN